jgi:uncharacterized OB-fold protein
MTGGRPSPSSAERRMSHLPRCGGGLLSHKSRLVRTSRWLAPRTSASTDAFSCGDRPARRQLSRREGRMILRWPASLRGSVIEPQGAPLLTTSISDRELVERFPTHPVDHDSAAHYRARLERRLALNRCADCGTWHHPPRPVCPNCWSSEVRPTDVQGSGTIHLVTFLHQGPVAEGVVYDPPYPVVTVELDDQSGLRFTSTLVDAPLDAVRIGARVELGWIDRGGAPLPVFLLGSVCP